MERRASFFFSFDNAEIHGGSLNGFFEHREIGFSLDDASGKADTRSHPSHMPLNSVPSEMKRQVAVIESLEQTLAMPGTGLIPLQVIRGNQTRILYLERYWLNADAPEPK